MKKTGLTSTATRAAVHCGFLLLVALSLAPQVVFAKAAMCGVDNGAPTAGRTVTDTCGLVSGTGKPGFTEPGNFYEIKISQNSRVANPGPNCPDGPRAGRFKMVSDITSEFWMSNSVGTPWASLLGATQTGPFPPIHLLEELEPGARFFVGYTTEFPFERFTSLFRLNNPVLPAGTLIRLGVRNGNLPLGQPVMSTDFSLGISGLTAIPTSGAEGAACESITFTSAPAPISGVDTSLFTWANYRLTSPSAFVMTIKANAGISATDLISVVEMPQTCGSQTAAGPRYEIGTNAPKSFFDIIDGGASSITAAQAAGEIVFNYTIDPKEGFTNDANGCSVPNDDYNDGPFAGFTNPGSIGDTIWRDWNGDADQDAGEPGIAGVTVTLERWDGAAWVLQATTTTDANGEYLFPDLLAGEYRVTVAASNFNAGGPLFSHDQTGDPDATCPGTGCDNQHVVTIALSEHYLDADFGYQPTGPATITGTAFEDDANNGVLDTGDPRIQGVTVELYADGILIATATTDTNGFYQFTGLAEGFDYVVVVNPNQQVIQDYFAPNAYSPTTPVSYAVNNLQGTSANNDFGFAPLAPASIGDTVFIDENLNGVYDSGINLPLAGVTVRSATACSSPPPTNGTTCSTTSVPAPTRAG
jgi:hypothetical protein